MKTKVVIAVLLLSSAAAPLAAQDAPLLGDYHFLFQLDGMTMQHVTFASDDAGLRVGAAGYRHMGGNWYLGLEAGAGANLGLFSDETSIGMFELNAKRAFPLVGALRADLGAGFSCNRVSYESNSWFGTDDDIDLADWVLGTQVLADLHVALGGVLAGAHVKYMLTQDVDGVREAEGLEEGWDYSNLTVGLHVGFLVR